MRMSMLAQSWLSVPPAPAWTSRYAIVCVCLARKQCFELAAGHFDFQALERRFRLGDRFVVLLGLAKLDQRQLVFELLLDPADGLELIVERIALAHDALRARLIVPEVGVFRFFIQFGKATRSGINVKDASSAAVPTA